MNEAGYPRFTKYMATRYSMGQLCCGTPVVNFQTDIAAAGRVENKHRLPQYWFEGVEGARLHLNDPLVSGNVAKRRGARKDCLDIDVGNSGRSSTHCQAPAPHEAHSNAEHHLVAYPISQG